MQLSVVVLNYNVRWFLQQCLLSVKKAIAGLDAEIIVVDNNSADDSCEMVRRYFPDVILIENPANLGFPKGNNIGVERAKGKYICILNPDTVVAEDTFSKVLAFAEKQQDFGIAGVRLIDGTGRFLPESKRGIPTPLTALTKIVGLYKLAPKLFGKYYASHLNPDQTGKVEILVGAFMLIGRETYIEVGGFDENCFMYSDDIDLSYMVLKTGRQNFYFHETAVIHYKGESTVRDQNYMNRFQEAMDFFYRKHFRSSRLFDIFMKLGAAVFSMMKKSATVTKLEINRFAVIGNAGLVDTIAAVTNVETTLATDGFKPRKGDCITFDTAKLDYRQIISQMQAWSSSDVAFRIAHEHEGFLIGSDSSSSRGEVVLLNNR